MDSHRQSSRPATPIRIQLGPSCVSTCNRPLGEPINGPAGIRSPVVGGSPEERWSDNLEWGIQEAASTMSRSLPLPRPTSQSGPQDRMGVNHPPITPGKWPSGPARKVPSGRRSEQERMAECSVTWRATTAWLSSSTARAEATPGFMDTGMTWLDPARNPTTLPSSKPTKTSRVVERLDHGGDRPAADPDEVDVVVGSRRRIPDGESVLLLRGGRGEIGVADHGGRPGRTRRRRAWRSSAGRRRPVIASAWSLQARVSRDRSRTSSA